MPETSTREEIMALAGGKWVWIRIREDTRQRLRKRIRFNDSYETVIKALLDKEDQGDVKSA